MSSSSSMIKPDVTLSLTLPSSPEVLKPEERGIRLIRLLLKSAAHASSGNLHRADTCLQQISELASVSGDSMQRLAAHFSTALAIRLVKRWPGLYRALEHTQLPKLELDRFRELFAQVIPYLSFAYAIIARYLVQSMTDEPVIHVVDLGCADSKLWVPLLRNFARLPHGPPHLKLTCVNTNRSALEKLGPRLVKEALSLDIPFQFNPINTGLRELSIDMLKVTSGEALALISILNLHVLLAEDDSVDAHFGGTKSNNKGFKACQLMGEFLSTIRSLSPKVLFLLEQEADHNLNRLTDRFVEGMHYYSAVFDSIDATFGNSTRNEERLILEEMFGREIENIVACEGLQREERHERYGKWVVRFAHAGFKPVRLWYDSMQDAKPMIEAYGGIGGHGCKIVNERSCLMICWHERPLYALSAWTC